MRRPPGKQPRSLQLGTEHLRQRRDRLGTRPARILQKRPSQVDPVLFLQESSKVSRQRIGQLNFFFAGLTIRSNRNGTLRSSARNLASVDESGSSSPKLAGSALKGKPGASSRA